MGSISLFSRGKTPAFLNARLGTAIQVYILENNNGFRQADEPSREFGRFYRERSCAAGGGILRGAARGGEGAGMISFLSLQ